MAADYSQLELRILAHLSRDRRLLQVLNSGEDVFKSIAAEWKMVDLESVDDCMRQQAKQVRYCCARMSRGCPGHVFDSGLVILVPQQSPICF